MSETRTNHSHREVSIQEIIESVYKFQSEIDRIDQKFTMELANWMRMQGFDPDHACFLIMPNPRRHDMSHWPKFVRFSPLIAEPMLVRDTLGVL